MGQKTIPLVGIKDREAAPGAGNAKSFLQMLEINRVDRHDAPYLRRGGNGPPSSKDASIVIGEGGQTGFRSSCSTESIFSCTFYPGAVLSGYLVIVEQWKDKYRPLLSYHRRTKKMKQKN